MKKWTQVGIAFVLFFGFVGCSAETEIAIPSSTPELSDVLTLNDAEDTVTITVPSAFLDTLGTTSESYVEDLQGQEGILDVHKNSDGSVTLKLTREKYDAYLQQIVSVIDENLNLYISDGSFPSIRSLNHNEDLTLFTLTVDESSYQGSMDSLVAIGVGALGKIYADITGVVDQKITIRIVSSTSGAVLNEYIYPDDTENMFNITDLLGSLTQNS